MDNKGCRLGFQAFEGVGFRMAGSATVVGGASPMYLDIEKAPLQTSAGITVGRPSRATAPMAWSYGPGLERGRLKTHPPSAEWAFGAVLHFRRHLRLVPRWQTSTEVPGGAN